jgi:hypothetical protein
LFNSHFVFAGDISFALIQHEKTLKFFLCLIDLEHSEVRRVIESSNGELFIFSLRLASSSSGILWFASVRSFECIVALTSFNFCDSSQQCKKFHSFCESSQQRKVE